MTRHLSTFIVPDSQKWTESVDVLLPSGFSRRGLFRNLVAAAPKHKATILRGTVGARDGYVDLLAAASIARRGRPVVLADATWEKGSRAIDRAFSVPRPVGFDGPPSRGVEAVGRLMRALDHPLIEYCVLSTDELVSFPETWGVDSRRVHFTPFCMTSVAPSTSGGGVFAGGDSLRDYRALLDAATSVRAPVTIASRLPLPTSVPPNVVAGSLEPGEYARRAAAADVVVVPLLAGTSRSAGQQTYLNAMAAGKAVIVTEAPGVSDYVTHGVNGLIVENEPCALAVAIQGLLDAPDTAASLGRAAAATAIRRFTIASYFERILQVADDAAKRAGL